MTRLSLACKNGTPGEIRTPNPQSVVAFSRAVLVGECGLDGASAHRVGVSKAGAEVQALAEALSNHDDIDQALSAYNAVRQPLSERIVLHGRKLGTQLGLGIETEEDRKMSKLLQSLEAILDRIAVPNFHGRQALD
jgi:hypothetical protein